MKKNFFLNKYKMPDPACSLKWGWSTILLETGSTSSCHRTHNDYFDTPEDIDDFHNTPGKLRARKLMLEGQWPGKGCEYCKNIEQAGGISDRVDTNYQIGALPPEVAEDKYKIVPIELINDPTAIRVSPTIVEVYFTNLCNLGCIYCSPKFSSVLENEYRKYELMPPQKFKNLDDRRKSYPAVLERFWLWLEKNVHSIYQYNILGGEPFYQPELETNIEFFEKTPAPDLNLKIFSNLKVNTAKFKSVLNRLDNLVKNKHVKTIELTCSLDCWGPEQEYIRTGLNLKEWENNFDLLTKEFQNIRVQVHGTMTGLTIKTIADLVKKINDINQYRRGDDIVYLTYNIASNPEYMHPGIFPPGFFDKDFEKIIHEIKENGEAEIMLGYQKTINHAEYKPELILKLKEELDGFDSRRGTNWKETFPWLDNFQV